MIEDEAYVRGVWQNILVTTQGVIAAASESNKIAGCDQDGPDWFDAAILTRSVVEKAEQCWGAIEWMKAQLWANEHRDSPSDMTTPAHILTLLEGQFEMRTRGMRPELVESIKGVKM